MNERSAPWLPAGGPRRRQRGVALAIIVWFLAAMSLLAAGIVLQARVDIKLAQLHATRARVEAAADGATLLALAQSLQPAELGAPLSPVPPPLVVTLGGIEVTVRFTALGGLIDLNSAPEGLLFLLFSSVDDLDPGMANELAFNVVEWRTSQMAVDDPEAGDAGALQATSAGGPRHARFESIEDLLLVSGIDRRIYEAVEDAVAVSQLGQSGVDWQTAPDTVLRALGGLDAETARQLAEARDLEDGGVFAAPAELDLSFQSAAQLSAFRVDATAEIDGMLFLRRRWVDRARPGSDGLPWQFFRTEALRVLPRAGEPG